MALIKELPVFERPREKMMLLGADKLSNGELLAILLGSGTRELSATALANQILSMEKDGLSYLMECTPEELIKIQGIGVAKACKIIAAVTLGKRIATDVTLEKVQVSSPCEVAGLFMEDLRYYKKECFKILLLNIKNEIMTIEDISVGNINTSIVDPRDVFRPAIKKSAAAIILIHNHPSGNPEPSSSDIAITKRLYEVGELMGIKVLDHLIIGNGNFTSLKELGLIE